MATDPRIDAYIAKSAEFARPILTHLRELVHAACPEVEEAIKWGMPFFAYRGAPLCAMAAFKQHCGFHFWLHRQVLGEQAEEGQPQEGMGQFGKLTTLKELPSRKTLTTHIRKAMALNEAGVKVKRTASVPKPPPTLPDDLAALLQQKQHAAARKHYAAFSSSAQRDYVEWINEAKSATTRARRLVTTLEQLAEGKPRNWKYRSRP